MRKILKNILDCKLYSIFTLKISIVIPKIRVHSRKVGVEYFLRLEETTSSRF